MQRGTLDYCPHLDYTAGKSAVSRRNKYLRPQSLKLRVDGSIILGGCIEDIEELLSKRNEVIWSSCSLYACLN